MPFVRTHDPVFVMPKSEKLAALSKAVNMEDDVDDDVAPGIPASVFCTAELIRGGKPACGATASTPSQDNDETVTFAEYGLMPTSAPETRQAIMYIRRKWESSSGELNTETVIPRQGISIGHFARKFIAHALYRHAATHFIANYRDKLTDETNRGCHTVEGEGC